MDRAATLLNDEQNFSTPLTVHLMWKNGQAISEKTVKDYTILYMYIAPRGNGR